jgi:DNA-binding transcriptional LysR family regulator
MNTPIDSRQLRAFCVLARTGNFTETARELHLTQSGISHSIKALESDVGCSLLDRVGKKVVLTHAGEQFLQHATKILEEMKSSRIALERLAKWGAGRLRIGASTTTCQHIIPPVLRELKKRFPEHVLAIQPGDTPVLVPALLRNEIDLAVALEPDSEPQLEFRPLFTDDLHFIVGPQHSWAQSRKVQRHEIPRQNYILYSKQSVTFRLIEAYFQKDATILNTVIELGSMEGIKELVKLELGISIAAPWIAQRDIAEGKLISLPLGRRKLQRRWGILHRRGKRLDLAESTFVHLCEQACANLIHESGDDEILPKSD